MRSVLAAAATVVMLFASFAVPACGEGGADTGGAGGGDDGKYRPAGNGQRQKEADACDALSKAQETRNQALACTATLRPCPTLILVQVGGTQCLEYDQGSVQGCVDYYNQQGDCAALAKSIDTCIVTTFADSAPNGCP
ncbi:Hypothetical protein A7982_01561 [Minicystis rosea]|nr:Hypothetical protein A7982_01561 [Minicystis rosea]